MRKKKEKKYLNDMRLVIKFIICLIYLIIITVLIICSYKLYREKDKIISWDEVNNVNDYTYIEISKMSEKFAYYNDTNVGLHFVIEEEDTGLWHTYLVAIKEDEIDKYKNIIDYTYERIAEKPESIKVYGYPVIIDDKIKELAIKNIVNFVPKENEVVINNDNYYKYLTNCYLDTTIEKKADFNILLWISLTLLFIVVCLLLLTILDKDRVVDNISNNIDNNKRDRKYFRFRKK